MAKPVSAVQTKPVVLLYDPTKTLDRDARGAVEKGGCQIIVAHDESSARGFLSLPDTVDYLVTELSVPDNNGTLEVIKSLKQLKAVPVIVCAVPAVVAKVRQNLPPSVDEIVSRPVTEEEFARALGEVRARQKAVADGEGLTAEDFYRLSIDDFISGERIEYDIFIRLSDEKFVKIVHKGEALPLDRVKGYKSKGVNHLYLRKEDFRRYVGVNLAIAPAVAQSPKISPEKKLSFLRATGELIAQDLFLSGIDEGSFDQARMFVEATVSSVSDQQDAFKLLSALKSHSDRLYAHSVAVSLYSLMLAREVEWVSPNNAFRIALAGLMHDIGKKEISPAVLAKPRADLTAEEIKLLESHTQRGVELLARMPSIPSEIIQIVEQHHELCHGRGYPAGLKKEKIYPLARMIAVADEFCKIALPSPDNPEGMAPEQAVDRLVEGYKSALDPIFLGALMQLFRITPPAKFVSWLEQHRTPEERLRKKAA